MARILTSAEAVVDALGGVQAVADEIGVLETAIYNWIRADRFPARTYVALHEMLADRSASAPDTLWTMAPRVSRASRQPEIAA